MKKALKKELSLVTGITLVTVLVLVIGQQFGLNPFSGSYLKAMIGSSGSSMTLPSSIASTTSSFSSILSSSISTTSSSLSSIIPSSTALSSSPPPAPPPAPPPPPSSSVPPKKNCCYKPTYNTCTSDNGTSVSTVTKAECDGGTPNNCWGDSCTTLHANPACNCPMPKGACCVDTGSAKYCYEPKTKSECGAGRVWLRDITCTEAGTAPGAEPACPTPGECTDTSSSAAGVAQTACSAKPASWTVSSFNDALKSDASSSAQALCASSAPSLAPACGSGCANGSGAPTFGATGSASASSNTVSTTGCPPNQKRGKWTGKCIVTRDCVVAP